MNKDEQTKALAELGGYTERKGVMEYDGAYMPWTIMERDGNEYNSTDKQFDYLTSRDAIIPLIVKYCGDDSNRWCDIFDSFCRYVKPVNYTALQVTISLIKATPQQLSEALLRSTGRWKETK